MPTTRDLIQRAARAAGVLASGETLDAAEEQDCLAILQRFRNTLGAQRNTIYEERRVTHNLTAGVRDYTIGAGGTINVARPLWIPRAGIIWDRTATTPYEVPISVLTDQDWAGLSMKTLSSPVQAVYCDFAWTLPATPLATISTYPTDSTGTSQLVLYLPMAVTGFEVLGTNYVFPPGYEDCYHYNLAERIAMEFEPRKAVPVWLVQKAAETLAIIKSANHRPVELTLDASLPGMPSSGYAAGRRIIQSGGY